jgi:pyruvate-ferredoxin/flavodoxin oxidoreductase
MEAKKATECGYWPTFRFNPALVKEGKNPMQLDNVKEPNKDLYMQFLMNEGRYAQLTKVNSARAQELFDLNFADAVKRYNNYVYLAPKDYSNKAE